MKSETNFKITSKKKSSATANHDSDDEEPSSGSFFSLDAVQDVEMMDSEMLEKLKLPTPNFDAPKVNQDAQENPDSKAYYDNTDLEENGTSRPVDVVSEILFGFKLLCYSWRFLERHVKYFNKFEMLFNQMQYVKGGKRKKEAMNIIDISADDLRPDSTEWIKNITDEVSLMIRFIG